MKNKKTLALIILASSLIVIVGILLTFMLLSNKKIVVPDFSDKTIDDVETWISENKLEESAYDYIYEYNEEIEDDYIISQSINPGEALKDEKLIITVSDGKDPDYIVLIPDFNNKTHVEIEEWFIENLFTNYEFEYVQSDTIEKEKFVSLNVTDNNQARSALILVSISYGKEVPKVEIDMPDLKDYTKTNIQAWAKTNAITMTFKTQASNTIPEGKVISQNPTAGSKILTGSKATVTLSSGKGISAISFSGKTKEVAEAWIKENGLKSTYTDVYDGKIQSGLIISNSPSSGAIAQGSSVSFNISKGLVPVDNYTNKSKTEFDAYISKLNASYNKSAKIGVTVNNEESNLAEGTIISQIIAGKSISTTTMVAPGTTITIKIAVPKKISVVSKAGSSENDFKTYITNLGLTLGSKSERYDDNKSSGIIISNDVGTYSLKASINYVVSKGKYTVDLNSYVNKSYSELANQINNANAIGAGYSISKNEQYSDNISSGNIISCSLNGKAISCNVSKGPQVTVKNYVGIYKPCIVNYCEVDGLKITQQSIYNDTYETGIVIYQSIDANTKVDPQTAITLTISLGKKPEPTPTPTTIPAMCKVPTYKPLSIFNGQTYDQAVSNVTYAFSDFHIEIIKVEGDDNPDAFNGVIKSITPSDLSDQTIDCLTKFKIEIYSGQ
ncbi:MAG: PASTA domain-containing protein [Erysipelotrichaceae bacterium]|nr:PASTA domain-containing protein [Erysipelotrichaceae bacterium]